MFVRDGLDAVFFYHLIITKKWPPQFFCLSFLDFRDSTFCL